MALCRLASLKKSFVDGLVKHNLPQKSDESKKICKQRENDENEITFTKMFPHCTTTCREHAQEKGKSITEQKEQME